jgi:carbonic anhydrase
MLSMPNQRILPFLFGGPLKGQYQFEQLHFHWGTRDGRGNEHLVDNRAHAMELHMVFWNKKYGTYAVAASKPDGIAVLAVFVKISELDNPAFNFVYLLSKVTEPNAKTEYTKPHKLQDLLPHHVNKYYTLKGSLTTPRCAEVVTWLIFEETIKISSAQVSD